MRSGAAKKKSDLRTVEKLVRELDIEEKIVLLERLKKETWSKRFHLLLKRVREKARQHSISDEEILRECKAVRREIGNEERAARRP